MISFQPPTLADRSFDNLVEDMLRRIPAHTPEWTNPRLGDPGRTLIELFAWLGDALLYRANLVPERQRLVFLKLLGLPLKPAQPARTLVSLAFAQPTVLSAVTLAPSGRVGGSGERLWADAWRPGRGGRRPWSAGGGAATGAWRSRPASGASCGPRRSGPPPPPPGSRRPRRPR